MQLKDFLSTVRGVSGIAVMFKLVVVPLIFLVLARFKHFSPAEMGTLFIMGASPTAVSCFPTAKAMGHDGQLSAKIVIASTALAWLPISLGMLVFLHH
jgi:predicted permease